MPRRRPRSNLNLSAEINVTSLVDVAFTLLLIFIITAPILQGGVEIQIPKAASETISATEGVIVTVTRDGRYYVGEAQASWEEFGPALRDAVTARQATMVYVRGDAGAAYGDVLRVIGGIKELDIAGVGLVAEDEMGLEGAAR